MGQPEKIEDLKFLPGKKLLDYYAKVDTGLTYKPIKYAGFAEKGTPTSSQAWKINYFVYDSDYDLTQILTAYGSWDDRLTLTYA